MPKAERSILCQWGRQHEVYLPSLEQCNYISRGYVLALRMKLAEDHVCVPSPAFSCWMVWLVMEDAHIMKYQAIQAGLRPLSLPALPAQSMHALTF